MVNERINVIATFTQKGLETFKKNIDSWNASMSAPLSRMKEVQTAQGGWNKRTKEGSTRMGRAALGFRKATHGMRGFRMEMLGVMFFGMAMQRMFGGLLKTATEWTGIMDILSMTLGVIFLPIMLQITQALIPIMTWFMGLSDTTKLWIGAIVVLGFVLGSIIMIIGQLALGIGSLVLAGGTILTTIGIISAVLVGLGVIIWGVTKIISNWGKDTNKVIQGIGIAIAGLGIILALFIGWWALIPIAIGIAIALIAKNWNTIWTGIKKGTFWIWNSIVSYIENSINKIVSAMNILIKWMNKIPGISIPVIPKLDLSFVKADLSAIASTSPTTPANYNKQGSSDSSNPSSLGTNITNIFNGFTNEDLNRSLDQRDSNLVSQIEANK